MLGIAGDNLTTCNLTTCNLVTTWEPGDNLNQVDVLTTWETTCGRQPEPGCDNLNQVDVWGDNLWEAT
jgi:hypothetical protein